MRPTACVVDIILACACRSPSHFVGLCLVVLVTSLGVALLVWMLLEPVHICPDAAGPDASSTQPGAEHWQYRDSWESERSDTAAALWQSDKFEADVEDGRGTGTHMTAAARHVRQSAEGARSWRDRTISGDVSPMKRPQQPGFAAEAVSLPQRLAAQLWNLLTGSDAGISSNVATGARPPLTHALLLAHSSMDASEPFKAHAQPAPWQPNAPYVPHAPVDWRSQSLRRARWLQAARAMSQTGASDSDSDSASEAASAAPTETLSRAHTVTSRVTAATTATVAGGGKGHSLGRAARKQLATLLCAVWQRFFDRFGKPVAEQPHQGDLVLELCDALAEVMHIEGADTLLCWRRLPGNAERHSSSAPHSPSASSPSSTRTFAFSSRQSAQGYRASDSGASQTKADALPQLQRAMCRHANVTWAFAANVGALRAAIASADSPAHWLPAAEGCTAWAPLLRELQAAWLGHDAVRASVCRLGLCTKSSASC